jgi:carbon-monoxide dehydrogenase iron sulfur subunit
MGLLECFARQSPAFQFPFLIGKEVFVMKQVVVHPERCVGCMQCMVACATAHSHSLDLFEATLETPLPKPRIHVGVGLYGQGFPNRCRHCDPAPCMFACLPGAIYREKSSQTVLIDPDVCINCASCAMACPYGVIRYQEDRSALKGKVVAVKCDNCLSRQRCGLIPACAEACKTGALTFETLDDAQKRKTNEVARSVQTGIADAHLPKAPGIDLLNRFKRAGYGTLSR